MIRVFRPIGLLALLAVTSCQQTITPPPLRSLAYSGALSLVCRDMTTGQGTDIKACPDAYATATDGRHTLLMVTQTGRGEVAVIDMHNRVVLDADPTVPGTEFLPIGAMPVSIVSTPGSVATFVATAEPGREAIFALPTSCVVAPPANQPQRDLTQWSACKLPSVPGEMVLLTDTSLNSLGELRRTCDGDGVNDADAPTPSQCPADWDAEQRIVPAGRRKLLVTLPNQGGVAILDARQLSDRAPGTFEPCTVERWLPLSTTVPTGSQAQQMPSDYPSPETCPVTPRSSSVASSALHAQPAGISLSDGRLYVADVAIPLLHVVDVSNPCDPHELSPFLPTSFDAPETTVYTSDVAVSDVTLDNHRFVYAAEKDGNGRLMAFDASDGATQRTPLLREGSTFLPFESPDRIYTNLQGAGIKDLLFVTHDVPIVNPPNQTLATRVVCDPTPGAGSPGADYRTSSDYSRGASPAKLRGIFAVAAFSDGHIGVVDVDDWDAPCRRPIVVNHVPPSNPPTPDWRGCQGDPDTTTAYSDNGTRTVSDESSCHVFERHHARSGRFIANNSTVGVGAPSLQTFPTLTSVNGNIATGSSSRSTANPRMLAVPFSNTAPSPPPVSTMSAGKPFEYSEVYVGTTQYYLPWVPAVESTPPPPSNATQLVNDPGTATNNSLLLPQVEPRAYLPAENFSVTYEGRLFDDRATGRLSQTALTLSDPDAAFCDQGVQDSEASKTRASDFLSATPDESQKTAFGAAYSDILQITSDFVDSDPYWITPDGSACAENEAGVAGITGCRDYFGTPNNFKATREWLVTEAYHDHLVFQQIGTDPVAVANLHCCFPGTVSYTVRAGHQWIFRGQQPMNNIVVGPNLRCTVAEFCDPRKQLLRNRVIEISSEATTCTSDTDDTTCKCPEKVDKGACSIGPKRDADVACIVSVNSQVDPTTNALGSACIFNSLKARFAIYRGIRPSIRDMAFTWQVVGGFIPFDINLANRLTGSAIMPVSMAPAPNLNALFVVDGVSGGIFELVLDPFVVNGDPYL